MWPAQHQATPSFTEPWSDMTLLTGPAAGCVTHGVNSDFWSANENMFMSQFRFRTVHSMEFLDVMRCKEMRVRRTGRHQFYPADICAVVVLRRLVTPWRFVDLVIFSEFHRTDYVIYFTLLLIFCIRDMPRIYVTLKPGSPISAISLHWWEIMDLHSGILLGLPMEAGVRLSGWLGNLNSQMDQSELYSGKEACHGIKLLSQDNPIISLTLWGFQGGSGPQAWRAQLEHGAVVHNSRHVLDECQNYVLWQSIQPCA